MTYNLNWGFSTNEECTSHGSFNDQDEPEYEFNIKILQRISALDHVQQNYCIILSISSDYESTSVDSIISFLWEQKRILGYSLATASQYIDPSRSRHVIAFSRPISSTLHLVQSIENELGLTVRIQKYSLQSGDATESCTESDSSDIMTLVGNLDHRKHILIQHIFTSMIYLDREWFVFGGEEGSSRTSGLVARINHESRQEYSMTCPGHSETQRVTEHLDVCKIKHLMTDESSGVTTLTISVYSCNWMPLGMTEITKGALVSCLCSGEEFRLLSADTYKSTDAVRKDTTNIAKKGRKQDEDANADTLFSSSSPFLSRLDEANIVRGYSGYLPLSHTAAITYYWYKYGFDITNGHTNSDSSSSTKNETAKPSCEVVPSSTPQTDEIDFFTDVPVVVDCDRGAQMSGENPVSHKSARKKRSDRNRCEDHEGGQNFNTTVRHTASESRSATTSHHRAQLPAVDDKSDSVTLVRLMSASGPRVYPMSMLTPRRPLEVLARSRRNRFAIATRVTNTLRESLASIATRVDLVVPLVDGARGNMMSELMNPALIHDPSGGRNSFRNNEEVKFSRFSTAKSLLHSHRQH